jgi:hypothetical protein
LAVWCGALACSGCTFPEVSITEAGASPVGSAGAPEGGASTGPSAGGAGGAPSVGGSAGAPGAGGADPGAGGSGGSGGAACVDLDGDGDGSVVCGGTDCDDDGDGFEIAHPDCLGNDCYDRNANAKPGPAAFQQQDRGDGSFDYDCSGSENLEYDVGCGTCQLGEQRFVYDRAVGCGEPGLLFGCGLLDCSGAGQPRIMGCR